MKIALSPKDFAAVKGVADHEQKTDLEYSKIVRLKVDLLLELVHSLFEDQVQMQEYLKWSEPMLMKMSFHSYTLLDIFRGTDLLHKGATHKVFDESSVYILFRTVLENYLTFYYLFVDNVADEEKIFRSNVYRYAGLKQRTSFIVTGSESKAKQAQELILTEELKALITASKHFIELKKDEKNQVLKGVKPRLINSWQQLITLCGFREDLFRNIYGFKSNYSHSEFISILQVHSKSYGLNESNKGHFSLFLLHMVLCKTVIEVGEVFPTVKVYYNKMDETIRNEVDFFFQFAVNKKIVAPIAE